MQTALKMNGNNAGPSRAELAIIAIAVVAIGVLLAMIVSLLQGQVHRAAQRDAMLQSQRVAMARCWQESPGPQAMRSCIADVAAQPGRYAASGYDMPRTEPVSIQADVSTVSLRY